MISAAEKKEEDYYKHLRETCTPQEQAKTFYELVLIKKAELAAQTQELEKVLQPFLLLENIVCILSS